MINKVERQNLLATPVGRNNQSHSLQVCDWTSRDYLNATADRTSSSQNKQACRRTPESSLRRVIS